MTSPSPYGDIFADEPEDDGPEPDDKVNRPRGLYYGVPDTWPERLAIEHKSNRPTPGSAADFRRGESGYYVPELYKTADDADRRLIMSMPAERLAALQDAMATVGLFGAKARYVRGFADDNTRKGFAKLLGYANQAGADYESTLQQMLASGQKFGAEGIGGAGSDAIKPGNATRLTAAKDLERQVQQAARTRLGRKLRGREMQRFVSIYQAIEKKDGANIAAASDQMAAGQDVTVTQPMSVDTAAEGFIDENFAQEEAGENAYGFLDVIKSMVGG